jgi:tRNA (guanine9-N1)-methyltransferase
MHDANLQNATMLLDDGQNEQQANGTTNFESTAMDGNLVAQTVVTDDTQHLSKNQFKKRRNRELKSEMWKQKKRQKKLDKQERRKMGREERDKEAREKMTEEQFTEFEKQKKEFSNQWTTNRREERRKQKERLAQLYTEERKTNHKDVISVCVDCSFNGKMTPGEIVSMGQQLANCYSQNSKSENPLYLSFTSLQPPLTDIVNRVNGTENWSIDRTDQHFTTHFSDLYATKDIYYLTADSPYELPTLQPGSLYVIGGIVDRNRYKSLCLSEAKKYNLKTARLPISYYLEQYNYVVLTVNQCYQILLEYAECKDWKQAFENAVPKRKAKKKPNNNNGNADIVEEEHESAEEHENDDMDMMNEVDE